MKKYTETMNNKLRDEINIEKLISSKIKYEFDIKCTCNKSLVELELLLIDILREKSKLELKELKMKLDMENQWLKLKGHKTYYEAAIIPFSLLLPFNFTMISLFKNDFSFVMLTISTICFIAYIVGFNFLKTETNSDSNKLIIYNNFKLKCINKIHK